MAVQVIQVKEFLQKSAHGLLLDVRSPMEFDNGHIPNAISIPIFNNEERAIVGTVYKQQGQKEAVLLGMELFGKKMHLLSKNVEELLFKNNSPQSPIFIHCWRGGKRSEAMAWLFSFYGFQVFLLVLPFLFLI